MAKRLAVFMYGLVSYVAFFVTFVYAVGFIGNLYVPKSMDSAAQNRMFTNRFMPNSTPVHENWFDDLQRVSTSAENAARLMDVDSGIDVRGLLRHVQVPTLVLHCDRDKVVSPEYLGPQSLTSQMHVLLSEHRANTEHGRQSAKQCRKNEHRRRIRIESIIRSDSSRFSRGTVGAVRS